MLPWILLGISYPVTGYLLYLKRRDEVKHKEIAVADGILWPIMLVGYGIIYIADKLSEEPKNDR